MSDLEDKLAWHIKAATIERHECPNDFGAMCQHRSHIFVEAGEPVREYKFASKRKWAFDFAWPYLDSPVAVEVQGGIWSEGRHVQPASLEREYEKLSTAAASGWRVLPVSEKMISSGMALNLIEQALRG